MSIGIVPTSRPPDWSMLCFTRTVATYHLGQDLHLLSLQTEKASIHFGCIILLTLSHVHFTVVIAIKTRVENVYLT